MLFLAVSCLTLSLCGAELIPGSNNVINRYSDSASMKVAFDKGMKEHGQGSILTFFNLKEHQAFKDCTERYYISAFVPISKNKSRLTIYAKISA